jgi:phosphotransferase system HPr (HPr) family protein
MTTASATVRNEYGIHCRPSAVIVKESQKYPGRIEVETAGGHVADAKNMLAVIGLGIACGDRVTIRVEGPDEEVVCKRLVELFQTEFDFPR